MLELFDDFAKSLREISDSWSDGRKSPGSPSVPAGELDGSVNPFVREWHNATTLHPLGLLAVLSLGVALICVPRRYATWPLLILACFIPAAQRLVVAGADFDLLRILVIFGTIRVVARGEYASVRWQGLDTAVLVWGLASTVIPLLRAGPGLLISRLGHLYDVLGMYFLIRCLVRDLGDIQGVAKGLMYLSLPVACLFAVEWLTGRNLFSIFGGVPELTMIRDGRLRCQGAFGHSIHAGCFWAAALPLMASLWWQGSRCLSVVSCGAALFIIFASASATPVLSVLAAGMGGVLYVVRGQLWLLRWGVVVLLGALQLVMKAPVWHLIARTSGLGGSSYHRYVLIDGAVRHFHEWWLVGCNETAHWGHYTFDLANVFIAQGVEGGVFQLAVFILMYSIGFRSVGAAMRQRGLSTARRIIIWAAGVSLFVHAVNQFGVSYFGQMWLPWYLLIGITAQLAEQPAPARVAPRRRAAPLLLTPRTARCC